MLLKYYVDLIVKFFHNYNNNYNNNSVTALKIIFLKVFWIVYRNLGSLSVCCLKYSVQDSLQANGFSELFVMS